MADLEIFTQGDTTMRTKMIDGEGCVLLGDVVVALGLRSTPSQVAQRLPEGVRKLDTLETAGGSQRATWVTEAGLYRVALRANTERAEPLIEWVTGEVLPTIRRTGSYGVGSTRPIALTDDELVLKAMNILGSKVEALTARAETAEAKVIEDAPKVEAWEDLMDSDGYFDMNVAARIFGYGLVNFYRRLRDERIIMPSQTLPYRQYDRYFFQKPGTRKNSAGETVATFVTKLRPEGVAWLHKRLNPGARPAGLVALIGGMA